MVDSIFQLLSAIRHIFLFYHLYVVSCL